MLDALSYALVIISLIFTVVLGFVAFFGFRLLVDAWQQYRYDNDKKPLPGWFAKLAPLCAALAIVL